MSLFVTAGVTCSILNDLVMVRPFFLYDIVVTRASAFSILNAVMVRASSFVFDIVCDS